MLRYRARMGRELCVTYNKIGKIATKDFGARHASRALRRACGQGAVLSLCMVRPGSGRFGVGFWVGFWVGLRARDFPTERVLSRTPLIIRTVDHFLLVGSRF